MVLDTSYEIYGRARFDIAVNLCLTWSFYKTNLFCSLVFLLFLILILLSVGGRISLKLLYVLASMKYIYLPTYPVESSSVAGNDHLKGLIDDGVLEIAQPGDGLGLARVDLAVGEHALVNVHADDAADDHIDGAHGRVAGEADGLDVLALEADGAGGDHGDLGLEAPGPRLGQAGAVELVDVGGHALGGDVDGLAQVVRGQLPAEDARGLGVVDRVLARALQRLVAAEHDQRRVEAQVVELAIGRQVVLPAGRHGRDPSYRPRHHARLYVESVSGNGWLHVCANRAQGAHLEGIVGKPVVRFAWLIEHFLGCNVE